MIVHLVPAGRPIGTTACGLPTETPDRPWQRRAHTRRAMDRPTRERHLPRLPSPLWLSPPTSPSSTPAPPSNAKPPNS